MFRWFDASRQVIIRLADGVCVPASDGNPNFEAVKVWEAEGNTVAAPIAPLLTATDVRLEASRRMQLLVNARDAAHLEQIIANGNREAIRLQNIRLEFLAGDGPDWTAEQTARAAQLKQFDIAIEAIRAASNVMEPDPPADYADNSHWPPLG